MFSNNADLVTLQAAITRLLRWASRPSVAGELAGPEAADLSPTDLWLLDGVVRHGPVRMGDLASWQGVDKSTVTSQLRRLVDRGLVARDPSPSDRRVVLVRATGEGRRLQESVSRAGARVLEEVVAGWTPEDRRAFATLFERFAGRLGEDPASR